MTLFSKQFRFSCTYFDKTIKGDTLRLDITGRMLLDSDVPDFDDFKKFVKEKMIDKLDNAFIYNKNLSEDESFINILALMKLDNKQKFFEFDSDVNMFTIADKILKVLNIDAILDSKDFRIYSIEISKSKSEKIIVIDGNGTI